MHHFSCCYSQRLEIRAQVADAFLSKFQLTSDEMSLLRGTRGGPVTEVHVCQGHLECSRDRGRQAGSDCRAGLVLGIQDLQPPHLAVCLLRGRGLVFSNYPSGLLFVTWYLMSVLKWEEIPVMPSIKVQSKSNTSLE